jgi:hypothetical protein
MFNITKYANKNGYIMRILEKLTHIFRKMSIFVCFIKKMLLILRKNFWNTTVILQFNENIYKSFVF